ncbi:MAG: ACT domain-containing protein [Anaerolineae bacterium]
MLLRLLPQSFAILKLTPPQSFPAWLSAAALYFVAATEDELSVMCPEHYVPAGVEHKRGYRCLRVDGDLAFDEIGVVARVSRPLADAGLSLFVVSTHDRDYVLLHQDDLHAALTAYQTAGLIIT